MKNLFQTALCSAGAVLAVLTVSTAWMIQNFWPYYSWGVGDFEAWVGRILWCAIGLSTIGFLADLSRSGRRVKILRGTLVVAISLVGLTLDFTPKTHAEGRYNFSTDWVSDKAENWREILKPLIGKPGIRALEIGSYEGRSAIWFLENVLTDPTSSITCIDVFIGAAYERNFDHNAKPFGEKITKIKAPSYIALRKLKLASYDFAYIDGSHDVQDVLFDAVLTWDLMKAGGIVIFDDYGDAYRGPKEQGNNPKLAIDAFLQVMGPNAEVISKGYQLVIRKKAGQKIT